MRDTLTFYVLGMYFGFVAHDHANMIEPNLLIVLVYFQFISIGLTTTLSKYYSRDCTVNLKGGAFHLLCSTIRRKPRRAIAERDTRHVT